jgi:putative oxidoreductase
VRARLVRLADAWRSLSSGVAWLPPTLARLWVGLALIVRGWVRLHPLWPYRDFIGALGLPWPEAWALVVADGQLICGAFLVLGLLTRPAALVLLVGTAAAVSIGQLNDLVTWQDLLTFNELTQMIVFVWLAIAGAGPLSLDARILRRLQAAERLRVGADERS